MALSLILFEIWQFELWCRFKTVAKCAENGEGGTMFTNFFLSTYLVYKSNILHELVFMVVLHQEKFWSKSEMVEQKIFCKSVELRWNDPTGTRVPGTRVPYSRFLGTRVPGTRFPGTRVPETRFLGTRVP